MADLNALATAIQELTPANQLRLAADLIEQGAALPASRRVRILRTAHAIVSRISTELGAVLALAAVEPKKSGGKG